MFKSKYTLWIIAFLIVTCLYNIFSIVQIEFNTVPFTISRNLQLNVELFMICFQIM